MKFSTEHVIALFTLSLLLVINSDASSAFARVKNVPFPPPAAGAQDQTLKTNPKSPLPPLTGLVNDFVNLINSESESRLESILIELRDEGDIEFAVVIIDTTGEQSIFDYSLAVARGWKRRSNTSAAGGGALLMLAMKDQKWRIQITDSLKKDLPNEVLSDLGVQMEDLIRQGKLIEGISAYVRGVIQRLEATRGFKLSRTP